MSDQTKQGARRVTLKGVNRALEELGFSPDDLQLVRGAGYFYLCGSIGAALYQSGLYSLGPRLSALSVEEWISAILSRVSQDLSEGGL